MLLKNKICLMNKKLNEVIKNYENSFNSLPEDSMHLSMLDKYIRKGDKLFVHKKTGVVTSELKYNSVEIAKYWSDVIFMSENKEDYSAHFPFAYSRLYYVLRTLKDFLSSVNYNNQSIDFCDFATGEGILPKLILNESLGWNISVTETSKVLCEKMQHDNFLIYNKNLGLGELPEFKVDVGAICWTLCNCIKPLDVLKEIYDREGIKFCIHTFNAFDLNSLKRDLEIKNNNILKNILFHLKELITKFLK